MDNDNNYAPPRSQLSSSPTPVERKGISSLWPSIILASIGLSIGFVLFSGIVSQRKVDDADLLVVVQAEAFQSVHPGFQVDPAKERVEKSRTFINGDIEIKYFYDDSADSDTPLNLTSGAFISDSSANATAYYYSLKLALDAAGEVAGEDITIVDTPELYSWGQKSRCGTFAEGLTKRGTFFMGRQGGRVSYFYAFEEHLDTVEEMEEVLKPPLEALIKYPH